MTSKLISFDVFDTAIFRQVYEPTDIFKLIEEKVGNDFFTKRLEAQAKAAQQDKYYTLADIYKYLPEFDMQTEIAYEVSLCMPNTDIRNIYTQEEGHYVFVSDMYLPSSVIKDMLEKCGYENPEVFVSCEEKAMKADGSLFNKIQQEKGKISKHYGDNYVADIEGAVKAGIEPVFKPALHTKKVILPSVKNPILKKYLAIIEDSTLDEVSKLAFFVAPLMYNFTKWVLNNRKEGERIFFLSRDMYTPFQIATKLGAKDIYYLHASRRSIAGILLQNQDEKLKERLSWILTPEEQEEKIKETPFAIKYLKEAGIREGDIIVDIGYIGTIQSAIEEALNIKLQGMYLQTNEEMTCSAKRFLQRDAIVFNLLVEMLFCSHEDSIEGYNEDGAYFRADSEERQRLSLLISNLILNIYTEMSWCHTFEKVSISDLEQILIHIQYYPSDEMLDVYNQKIFTNREKIESGIGFDIEEIKKGNLRKCYACSYSKELFRRMLSRNKEYAYLEDILI